MSACAVQKENTLMEVFTNDTIELVQKRHSPFIKIKKRE